MNVSRLSRTRHTTRTPLAARLTALAVAALTSASLAGGALPASALPTSSAHEAPASPAHRRLHPRNLALPRNDPTSSGKHLPPPVSTCA